MPELSPKPEVKENQAQITKISAYQTFIEKEGIPNITGFAIDDLRAIEVEPWSRLDSVSYTHLTLPTICSV